jgi:hypothetical protein
VTSSDNIGALTAAFFISTIVFGVGTYIAWFKPDTHRRIMTLGGDVFGGTLFDGQQFLRSSFNFWLTRIMCTLAFVASFAIFGYGLFLLVSDLLFGL